MKVSQKCLELIKECEGCSLHSYQDIGGVWTIGYGCTHDVGKNDKITQEEAESMLLAAVLTTEAAVNLLVTVPLNQNQFDALVSFTYNVGEGHLESSTLLRLLNLGDYEGAAEQLLRWNKVNGQIVFGLVKRRHKEYELFLKAEESPENSDPD